MPKVSCNVANCTYWDKGNVCGADEIIVEIDRHAKSGFNEEFGLEPGEPDHKDYAKTSSGTCCYTFKPKSKL